MPRLVFPQQDVIPNKYLLTCTFYMEQLQFVKMSCQLKMPNLFKSNYSYSPETNTGSKILLLWFVTTWLELGVLWFKEVIAIDDIDLPRNMPLSFFKN